MDIKDEKYHKMCQLKMLVDLADADSKFHINEGKFLKHIAKQLGLNDDDFQEVVTFPKKYPYQKPKDDAERMSQLYYLLFLMKVDGDIAPKEVEFIRSISLFLGVNLRLTDELIQLMYQYLGKELPPDAIKETIKKLLN